MSLTIIRSCHVDVISPRSLVFGHGRTHRHRSRSESELACPYVLKNNENERKHCMHVVVYTKLAKGQSQTLHDPVYMFMFLVLPYRRAAQAAEHYCRGSTECVAVYQYSTILPCATDSRWALAAMCSVFCHCALCTGLRELSSIAKLDRVAVCTYGPTRLHRGIHCVCPAHIRVSSTEYCIVDIRLI